VAFWVASSGGHFSLASFRPFPPLHLARTLHSGMAVQFSAGRPCHPKRLAARRVFNSHLKMVFEMSTSVANETNNDLRNELEATATRLREQIGEWEALIRGSKGQLDLTLRMLKAMDGDKPVPE